MRFGTPSHAYNYRQQVKANLNFPYEILPLMHIQLLISFPDYRNKRDKYIDQFNISNKKSNNFNKDFPFKSKKHQISNFTKAAIYTSFCVKSC